MKRLVYLMMVVVGVSATSAFAKHWADADGDGKVSLQEWIDGRTKAAQKNGTEVKEKSLTNVFKQMDTDGDGFLSEEELAANKPK